MLTHRENWLRAVRYERPEWIPVSLGFSPLTWREHREGLEDVLLQHPVLFPGFQKGHQDFDGPLHPVYSAGQTFKDNWGCLWFNAISGLEGQVVGSPLADWPALDSYRLPDLLTQTERGTRDWDAIAASVKASREAGGLTWGDGERLFDRLYFLRGFDNLMLDIATDDPRFTRLVGMLTDYELRLVGKWAELGVEVISFHTDIGHQQALMISPDKFRKHIKPMYARIFGACREAGALVYLSSDGCLLEIVDDLIECGVAVHDPQLRACTIDGIARAYKGKMCANVDLDRQMFRFCTPDDIWRQIEEVVEKVGSPEGGLMLAASVWDEGVPLENIEALCAALEQFRGYYG
ncbi:MAG: hypothetical protein HYU66_06675 [Armatimonadetes bacterium]|nr:hypothetical protein [Armatimonadota bacterium]